MAIIRWDPLKELSSLRDEMERIFEDLVGRGEGEWKKSTWYPPVDIYETDNEIVLKAELPGVDQKDVEVRIENDTLILKGEKRIDRDTKTENFHRAERVYGAFQRSFSLPQSVDKERIKASLKRGILTLVLPKKEEVKPKQIEIQLEE